MQFAFRALGISDEPPLLVIGIQDKNFSREMIQKSGEFVLNVCSENQLHAVDKSRDLSGRNVEDKFGALGLETVPAKLVEAPLVAGCHANVECRVVNEFVVQRLCLFVGEALVVELLERPDDARGRCRHVLQGEPCPVPFGASTAEQRVELLA